MGAVVPASVASAASQSSRPRPLRTTRSASIRRRTSRGCRDRRCAPRPPLGTRLTTSTRSPPTRATMSANTVVVATTLTRPSAVPVRLAAAGDHHGCEHDRRTAIRPGHRTAARDMAPSAPAAHATPRSAAQAPQMPKISRRWAVTVNPDRAPIPASTAPRPASSTSSARPQAVQMAWWWWTLSQAT